MSRRSEWAYWGDMLDTARAIQQRISTATRADLDDDVDFQLGLMYRLQVIGEAASKLPPAAKQSHPEIRRSAQQRFHPLDGWTGRRSARWPIRLPVAGAP